MAMHCHLTAEDAVLCYYLTVDSVWSKQPAMGIVLSKKWRNDGTLRVRFTSFGNIEQAIPASRIVAAFTRHGDFDFTMQNSDRSVDQHDDHGSQTSGSSMRRCESTMPRCGSSMRRRGSSMRPCGSSIRPCGSSIRRCGSNMRRCASQQAIQSHGFAPQLERFPGQALHQAVNPCSSLRRSELQQGNQTNDWEQTLASFGRHLSGVNNEPQVRDVTPPPLKRLNSTSFTAHANAQRCDFKSRDYDSEHDVGTDVAKGAAHGAYVGTAMGLVAAGALCTPIVGVVLGLSAVMGSAVGVIGATK